MKNKAFFQNQRLKRKIQRGRNKKNNTFKNKRTPHIRGLSFKAKYKVHKMKRCRRKNDTT
jgi:hypothetical protein